MPSLLAAVRALYEYDEWANDALLDTASRLSDDELTRKLGASFESVQGNLAHILAGQTGWLERWTSGRNTRSVAEVQSIEGLQAIRSAFAESHARLRRYVESLSEPDLDRVLSYRDSRGDPHERETWRLLLHLVNHGTHHRAETALVMTGLGKTPGELDYHLFELERAGRL